MGMIYLFSNTPHDNVENVKIIDIHFLHEDIDFSKYNALIFTSKNSVIALDKLSPNWKQIPSYCIGEPTAKKVKELGGVVEYIAKSSYGYEFAQEVKPLLHDKKVLFPRAKVVVSKIADKLKPIEIEEKIVYETICNKNVDISQPSENAVLIFTSPSAIKCYLQNFSLFKTHKIICIGTKTASALPKNIEYVIPNSQTIADCVMEAQKFISN